MDKQKENRMSTLIRIAILSWSAALLTASYAGALAKMDPTFIATVFTASAAPFGINTMKKGGDEEDDKKPEPKREEYVVTPPVLQTPEVESPVVLSEETSENQGDSSLVERVEALEAKVDEEKPYQRGEL